MYRVEKGRKTEEGKESDSERNIDHVGERKRGRKERQKKEGQR